MIRDGATPRESRPLRVSVIVVLLAAFTPSEASKSCMTKTEAREEFGSVHIYWHGKDHCWDATPKRRYHQIQRSRLDEHIRGPDKKIEQAAPEKKNVEPRWQTANSEMLLDEEPVRKAWTDRWVDIEPAQPPIVARWVDIAQVVPPPVIEPAP